MSKNQFFKDDDCYLGLTGETAKGFENLFAAFTGSKPDDLSETCISKDSLARMQEIKIHELPDDWAAAFINRGFKIEPVTEHIKKPVEEKPVEDVEEKPVEEDEVEEDEVPWKQPRRPRRRRLEAPMSDRESRVWIGTIIFLLWWWV